MRIGTEDVPGCPLEAAPGVRLEGAACESVACGRAGATADGLFPVVPPEAAAITATAAAQTAISPMMA
ncbi:MAG TPA: hypothetical protein VNZ01_01280 [Solirubrobacteraceae bacterium]|jgi:hypothetical protein|nr:hypothetical protein [Solirubrobacteraceae bacterium]